MPPEIEWYQGHQDSGAFIIEGPLICTGGFCRRMPTVNSSSESTCGRTTGAACVAAGLDLLALRGTEITEVVSFLTPEIFSMFGLPDEPPVQR
jgi:hypothetical protein